MDPEFLTHINIRYHKMVVVILGLGWGWVWGRQWASGGDDKGTTRSQATKHGVGQEVGQAGAV